MTDHPCTCYQCDSDDCVQKTAHPAIPEEVRGLIEWLIEPYFDKSEADPPAEVLAKVMIIKDWLAKCPEVSDKSVGGKLASEMTVRERFIMSAMQGILANMHAWEVTNSNVANYSIEAADALIAAIDKEREKQDLVISPPREPKVTP